jgi:hypothetical protein
MGAQRRAFGVATVCAVVMIATFAVLFSDLVPLEVRLTASAVGLMLAGIVGMVS